MQEPHAGLVPAREPTLVRFGKKEVQRKTSETLLQSLREYLRDDLLFGPLKFQDGLTGEQIGSVSNVSENSTSKAGAAGASSG